METRPAAQLARASLFVLVGSNLANVLNAAYTFLLARVLAPAEYGAVVSLVSLVTVATVAAGAVSTVVGRFTALAAEADGRDAVGPIVGGTFLPLAVTGCLSLPATWLCAPLIATVLRIP